MNHPKNIELKRIKAIATTWLRPPYDRHTQLEVKKLFGDEEKLIDSFYQSLTFGTGGLRAKMGVGINRINIYTLALITQGIADYMIKNMTDSELKVAIAYDTRNNSQKFALTTAEVFSGNNIKTFLFREPRSTPQLAFAVRHLQCQLGIVITASHNAKEYNGYKVYSSEGAQIVSPLDRQLIEEISQLNDLTKIKKNQKNIIRITPSIDQTYFQTIKQMLFYPQEVRLGESPILYSPLHGTGLYSVYPCLKEIGFRAVNLLKSQSQPDGNFPTVSYPNPEDRNALTLGIESLEKNNFKLLMVTDPDSDRLAVVTRDKGKTTALDGNQIGILLADYILENLNRLNRLPSNAFMVRTIVTSSLIDLIAASYQVPVYRVLTGFKYIGELITLYREKKFIFGMEESYGYLINDYIRDKDAVSSCILLTEMFYQLEKRHLTFTDRLQSIYQKYGYFLNKSESTLKEGKNGTQEMIELMKKYRHQPPKEIADEKVKVIRDYQSGKERHPLSGETHKIELPRSNVLQFELADQTIITIRPSGTEPKLKYYFNLRQPMIHNDLKQTHKETQTRFEQIKNEFLKERTL